MLLFLLLPSTQNTCVSELVGGILQGLTLSSALFSESHE